MELLFIGEIDLSKLSKNDKLLFISYLLVSIHRELFKKFNSHNESFFSIIKQDSVMEEVMLETNFLIYLVNDILSTEEYSLSGIANYVRIPEDVIYDLVAGLNKNPSSYLWKKIINLHSTVRRDFYRELINRIRVQLVYLIAVKSQK